MLEIIPAIIPKDFYDLEEKMSLVVSLVPVVQIDITDGTLTPKRTWPYAKMPEQNFDAILKEEKGFPFWEDLDFEAHLMVKNPEKIIDEWILAGAKRVILHVEADTDLRILFKNLKDKYPGKDSLLYTEIGLAINIDTPNEKLDPFMENVDLVQCMGIAQIGSQGQSFDDRVVVKVSDLRNKYPELTISVDGGVSLDTAPTLVDAGANRLVVGSAIFENDDIAGTIRQFKNL